MLKFWVAVFTAAAFFSNAQTFSINFCERNETNLGFLESLNISRIENSHNFNCSFGNLEESSELSFENFSQLLNPNGSLQFDLKTYETDAYCIQSANSSDLLLKLCSEADSFACEFGCIRKCCKSVEGISYGAEDGTFACATANDNDDPWKPTIYQVGAKFPIADEYHEEALRRIRFVNSSPGQGSWCGDQYFILDSEEFEGTTYLIRILEDGNVVVKNHKIWRTLVPGKFCIDRVLRNSTNKLIVVDCSDSDINEPHVERPVYILFQAIACLFLTLTVFVYLALWEKQNIHSWTLLGYAISMLALHLSLFLTYFHNDYIELDSSNDHWSCLSLAISSHFLYLSTFCWLWLINVDVWWTFKKLALTAGGSKRRRFLGYVLFTLLTPTAVLFIGWSLSQRFREDSDSQIVILEYSPLHCYISDYSSFFYKFLPASLLLTSNFVLFLLTIFTLYNIGESTKLATARSSQGDIDKSKFLLFVKLFFVMGLAWCLELISYFAFGRGSPHPLAYLLDIVNILQPIAIFGIFVCKADIFRGLQLKFPFLRRIFYEQESSNWKTRLFQLFGLKQLPARFGSGLSTATQISNLSVHGNGTSVHGNHVSFELKGKDC